MTTVIVLAGLMLVVPRTNAAGEVKALTVLVLNTENVAPQFGHPVVTHDAEVTNIGGAPHALLNGAWTVKSDYLAPVELGSSDRRIVLKKIYGHPLAGFREKDCLGPDFATKCVAS